MGAASVFVFPSEWYEPFGRVAIESFAKGTPVIASDMAAMAEIVEDQRNGLLFRPGDSQDLAAKLQWPSIIRNASNRCVPPRALLRGKIHRRPELRSSHPRLSESAGRIASRKGHARGIDRCQLTAQLHLITPFCPRGGARHEIPRGGEPGRTQKLHACKKRSSLGGCDGQTHHEPGQCIGSRHKEASVG